MRSALLAATALAIASANAIVVPSNSSTRYNQNNPVYQPLEPRQGSTLHLPLYHHSKRNHSNPDETMEYALRQIDLVVSKWATKETKRNHFRKRQTIGLENYGNDQSYYGQVSVGNPKQNFNVVLDTGSADFWLADSACTNQQCVGNALFNTQASSSFRGSSTPFQIQYGTGAVSGTLGADDVTLAGYTVNALTFATVNQLATNSLSSYSSGIMGLAFQSLATSGATPIWQVLAEQNKLQTNVFSFQLSRAPSTSSSTSLVPGGVFTLGTLDNQQYNGNVNFVNLSGQDGFWTIPLDAISVDGSTATLSSDNTAAIDTGTSFVAMPPQVLEQIFSQIPGSSSVDQGGGQSLFTFPCDTTVQVSLRFGGQDYQISPDDFNAGRASFVGNDCVAGIFSVELGQGSPDYVIGDTFLKNVFTAFRYEPASVGFASLKNGDDAQIVSTTSGAVGGTATAAASSAASSVIPTSSSETSAVSDPGLPSVSAGSNTGTSVAGGSGLPTPSAASTNSPSTPSLISASAGSSQDSSSAATLSPLLSSVSQLAILFLSFLLGASVLFL